MIVIPWILSKYRENKLNKAKITLNFTPYEMDLILKSIWMGYKGIDNELFLFKNKSRDKDSLFYLHRFLSCKANEFFYDKINDNYFKYEYNSKKVNKPNLKS